MKETMSTETKKSGQVKRLVLDIDGQRYALAPSITKEEAPLTGTRLLKAAQVMPLTGHTDTSAFWQFVHRNAVPFVRLGKRSYRFEPQAIDAFIRSRRVGKGVAA